MENWKRALCSSGAPLNTETCYRNIKILNECVKRKVTNGQTNSEAGGQAGRRKSVHFNNYYFTPYASFSFSLVSFHFFLLFFFLKISSFTVSTCQEQPTPIPPLTLQLEGLKLGQRALYSCPVGYFIQGISNATCLASGKYYYSHLSCITHTPLLNTHICIHT